MKEDNKKPLIPMSESQRAYKSLMIARGDGEVPKIREADIGKDGDKRQE